MKGKQLVSICIPLYKRDEWFDKLIKSIKEHDAGIPYEICIGEGKNSTSVNRNIAQRKAKSNIICQLDGDAEIIQDGWLLKMYNTLMSNEKNGIVGCIVELPNGSVDHCGTVSTNNEEIVSRKVDEIHANLKKEYRDLFKSRIGKNCMGTIDYNKNLDKIKDKIYPVIQCSGVCFMYDSRKTGEFLELIYKKAGWEDVDLMARVLFSGYNIVVDGRVRVKHPNHVRSKEEHDMRDKVDSERGFNHANLTNFSLRWGMI